MWVPRSLPHLIFLDLYNNRIAEIANLDCVPGLRVLMLGKNKITRIENLTPLLKLDVLDLHVRSRRHTHAAALTPFTPLQSRLHAEVAASVCSHVPLLVVRWSWCCRACRATASPRWRG